MVKEVVGLVWWLDLGISKGFSNQNDSVVLWLWQPTGAQHFGKPRWRKTLRNKKPKEILKGSDQLIFPQACPWADPAAPAPSAEPARGAQHSASAVGALGGVGTARSGRRSVSLTPGAAAGSSAGSALWVWLQELPGSASRDVRVTRTQPVLPLPPPGAATWCLRLLTIP